MKYINLLLLMMTFALVMSCINNTPTKVPVWADTVLIDSFKVSPIQSSIEIKNLKWIDGKLMSITPEDNSIRIYQPKSSHLFTIEKIIYLESTHMPHSFFKSGKHFFVIDMDGFIFQYDSAWHLNMKHRVHFDLNTLKDNHILAAYNNLPVKANGDTFVAHIFHKDFSGINDYLVEQPYIKFRITPGSVVLLEQLGQKPPGLNKYFIPIPSHCYKNDAIYTLYPCFDTIYKFDLKTKTQTKTALHNPEYHLPRSFPIDSVMNHSFVSTYFEKNFLYAESILYNPLTDHFVIFYYTYTEAEKQEKHTHKRKTELHAMVLDKDLKTLHHLTFNRKYYSPQSFFFIQGKGIALGLFMNKFHYETTTFHIFNF